MKSFWRWGFRLGSGLFACWMVMIVTIHSAELGLTTKDQMKQVALEPAGMVLPANPINGTPLNGAVPDLTAYTGKTILLNFWATWCLPCVKEMPDLATFQQLTEAHDVVVLTIAVGEPEHLVRRFLERYEVSLPVLVDTHRETSRAYGVQQLPVSYVLNSQHQVVARAIGVRNWKHPQIVTFFQTFAQPKS